ncbi:MAG: CHAT domain-containing protein, partial [Calditrichaeota bacterium]
MANGLKKQNQNKNMKTQLRSRYRTIFISAFLMALSNLPAAPQQTIFKIGSEFTQLTTHPDSDLSPRISPDGKWMAFVSNQSGNYDIYIKNLKTGRSRQMTTHQADDFYPVWDKKSRYLIFVSQRSDAKGDLFRLNLRSVRGELIGKGEPERLTTYMGFDGFPSISEYDEHIAWVSDRTGRPEIWFMTKKNQNVRQLTHGGATHPAWSPKQPYIAFTSFRQDSGHGDIWIINLYAARELVETQARTDSLERPMWPVTKGAAADGFPTWSPDANTILFIRNDFDDNRDGVISPSDKSVLWAVDVSHLPAEHQTPLNPCYLMYRNSFDERIVHTARPLISAAYDPRQPEYGSDGSIYFVSEIKGNHDIYQVKADDILPETKKADPKLTLPESLPDQLDSHDIYRLFTKARLGELSIDQQRILWQRIQSFQTLADIHVDSAQQISSSLYEIAVTFFTLGYSDQARKHFDILLSQYSNTKENSAYAELFKLSLDQLSADSEPADNIRVLFQNLEFVRTNYTQDSLFVARSMLLEGDLYEADHQSNKAEQLFREIPLIFPTQRSIGAAALLKLATLQKQQGRFMDSFFSYSQLLQQYYSETALIRQVQEGILDLFTSGLRDDDDLLAQYKAIIRHFSTFDLLIVEPFFKIAEIYIRRLDYDTALETLDYIQSHFHHLPEENFKAQMMYADVLLKKGELLQATNSLENTSALYRPFRTDLMQKSDERFTDILYQSARELLSTQNYSLAATRFQQVLQVNPRHIPSHQGYIESRYLMGEIDQVISEYNQALINIPNDNIHLYALGLAYSYKGARRNLQNFETTVADAHALLQSNEVLHKALSFDYNLIEAYLTLSFNYELLENDQHLKAVLPKSFWRKAGGTLSAPVVWLYHTLTFYEETKPPRYYEMAIQELTRALALNDERQNPHLEALLALNMANNYYNLGEFGFRKAYEFYHVSLANDSSFATSEEEVLIKEKMGHCSLFVNDQKNGPYYLTRAIELYRKSNNELRVLLNIKRLALLYEIGENSPKALEHYMQAAEIERRRELWDGLMRSYRSIAFHHFRLNQRRLSAQYANESLQLLESGKVLRKKSNPIYLQIGFFDLYFPFPYDLRKVGAKSTIELSTEEEEAFIYTILAQAFQDDKMFDDAISFYQKKFQIYELRHDIDAQAVFQNNMGYLYFLKGDYDSAWRMFTNSYWWCVKTKYIPGQLLNLENAAQVVLTISKEENAIVRQNLAKYKDWISGKLLEMLKLTAEDQTLYAATHAHYYLLLANLAVITSDFTSVNSPADVEFGYSVLQQAAQADAYLRQAAQLAESYGLSSELCAITFHRAENHLRFGDQRSALQDFVEARDMSLQFKLRQLQWQIDTSLGKLLQNTTLNVQKSSSLPAIDPSFYFQEAIRILESDQELPSGLTATRKRNLVQEPYRLLIDGMVSQNRTQEALQTAERMREKAFIDILGENSLQLLSVEQQTLWDRTDSLQTEIERLELSMQSVAAKSPKVQHGLTLKLEELQEQYAAMINEIRHRAPELEHLIHISSIPINKIQATLHGNEAILYQLISEMQCRFWLVTSQTIHFVDAPIRKADLNSTLQKWLIEGYKDSSDVEIIADVLSRLPLREFQHVTFIPDFDLFSFPWSTLFEQCGFPQIETIVSSLTSYMLSVNNRRPTGHRIFIAAGALADSIKQLAEFQVTLPDSSSNELLEEQLPQELSEANILHLEGKMDWNITFPSYSKFIHDDTSIPNVKPSLFYAEKTNATLITFNSKNLKLNKQQVEPLIAWERAFLYNGATTVLVSLWPTDDSSHVFYRRFYAHLQTQPPSQALRQTRYELEQLSLPFLWYAGYQLYGFYGYAGGEEQQYLNTSLDNKLIQAEDAFRRGQWSEAIDNDLQTLAEANPTSSIAAETENHLFKSAVNGGKWQTVISVLKKRIDAFSKRKEWQAAAEAMLQLHVAHLQLQQNNAADVVLQQYRQTCRAYGLEFDDATAFVQFGDRLREGASYRQAVDFFRQAADRYQRQKNSQKQIECLVRAGSILAVDLRDISAAQNYLQKALTTAQAGRFVDRQISILLEMSRAQLIIENYSSAQTRLDQAIKVAGETKTELTSEFRLLATEIFTSKGDLSAAEDAIELLYP